MTEILHTRLFREKFMRCLSHNPCFLQIAVPYIGKIPGHGSIVEFSRFFMGNEGEERQFTLITRPPGSGAESVGIREAEIITNMGVELIIRTQKFLHSKIYQFTFSEGNRAAFVGSANFTMGGFDRNIETMAYFLKKGDNAKVASELERLAWKAHNFVHWRAGLNHPR